MDFLLLAQESVAHHPQAKLLLYGGFILFVLVMLALDLGVFNKTAHVISTSEALRWTGVCVVLALIFTGVVYYIYEHHWLGIGLGVPQFDGTRADTSGSRAAIQFLTGYVIEYSLSLDNIFVIALIFAHFAVKAEYQHRVLFWGILGALLMRGAMIAAGGALIAKFNWIIYIFGGLLLITGIKMLVTKESEFDAEQNWAVRIARRIYPISSRFEGQKFFTRLEDGRRAMTPMFLALIVVEFTDLIFAVDSIPAIFAVTLDPFIVFTSNVFAILGLRSLYFALAGLMGKFRHLKVSLALVLVFVGVKMLVAKHFHLHPAVSLGVIAAILAGGVIASLAHPAKESGSEPASGGHA